MPCYFQKANLSLQMISGACAKLLSLSTCSSHPLSSPHVLIALCKPGMLPINSHYGARDTFCKSLLP